MKNLAGLKELQKTGDVIGILETLVDKQKKLASDEKENATTLVEF